MKKPVYKRELSHSYLIMEDLPEEKRGQYQYRMILKNRVPGLLPCSERFMEGKTCLYYDISSRQSLEQLYVSASIGLNEIRGMIDNLAQVLDAMAEYLLEERCLILKPEYIYMDLETEQLFFLYYPFAEEEGSESQYLKIAEFFLEHVDHKQEMAVSAAYQFYKMSKAKNFTVVSFRTYLEKGMQGKKDADRNEQGDMEKEYAREWYLEEAEKKGETGNFYGKAVAEEGMKPDYAYPYGRGETDYGEAEGNIALFRDTAGIYEYQLKEEEDTAGRKENRIKGKAGKRKERKGEIKKEGGEKGKNGKKGRIGGMIGLAVTAIIFLGLCAVIWYLKPVEEQKVLFFAGLAADGACLLLFLWKVTSAKENEKAEEGRKEWEEEEKGSASAFWEEYTPVVREELDGPTVYLRETGSGREADDGGKIRPRLTGSPDGREMEYSLDRLPVMVGKMKSRVQLLLSDASVSRIHARFVEKDGRVALIDLNSTNGTFVNGIRLEQEETVILEKGDEILFGNVSMLYEE